MVELSSNEIAKLMQQHRHELLRFLVQRVSCVDTAEDIFQETFIRYAEYKAKHTIENPRAFIFKIAANLAIDYVRSRSRHAEQNIEETQEQDEPLSLSVEQTVMSEQQVERLIAALSELSPKCREVFILLKFKQYSYAEVEEKLGISQTMIFKYVTQAMKHCRERLDDFN